MKYEDQEKLLAKIIAFKKRDKFSIAAWNARWLNPSDDDICEQLEYIFDNCTIKLITAVENSASKHKLRSILTRSLFTIDKSKFDTEEREYIVDLFHELGELLEIDINKILTRWLYGYILAFLLQLGKRLNKQKIVRTLEQACTKCHCMLKTHVLKEEQDIPETSWQIVRCNNCQELNLISTGPAVKEMRAENYSWVENLSIDDYTFDEAKLRLEQIKAFRNFP